MQIRKKNGFLASYMSPAFLPLMLLCHVYVLDSLSFTNSLTGRCRRWGRGCLRIPVCLRADRRSRRCSRSNDSIPLGRWRGTRTSWIRCLRGSSANPNFRNQIRLSAKKYHQKHIESTRICLYTPFFFIRTPFFSLSLDVLIFSAISASGVLIDVLKHFI